MDENDPLVQIIRQINELSGAALDALLQQSPEGGPAEGGGEPAAPGGGEPVAPPQG
jgi:hypothetical protein